MSNNDTDYLRRAIRLGQFTGPTTGLAKGFAQANLVILPADYAQEFAEFCSQNPKPCPLLEITSPGDPVPHRLAPSADLRYDLPAYNVYLDGKLEHKCTDVADLWRTDLVSFLLGCSFTFEHALLQAGIPVRHIELGCNVSICTALLFLASRWVVLPDQW